jgi:hypothetical protein
MITKIYLHRSKEENYELQELAEAKGIKRDDLLYVGYEVEMKVEITEDKIKVLEINGIKIKEGVFI